MPYNHFYNGVHHADGPQGCPWCRIERLTRERDEALDQVHQDIVAFEQANELREAAESEAERLRARVAELETQIERYQRAVDRLMSEFGTWEEKPAT